MPLRFLFVNIGYPPFVGGAQTYVQQLAESLAADGHAVTVLTTDAAEIDAIWSKQTRHAPVTTECLNGVTVRRLPLSYLPGGPMAFYALRRLTVALASVPGVPTTVMERMARFTPWLPGLSDALEAAGDIDIVHGFAIPFESLLLPAAAHAASHDRSFFVTPFLHTGPDGLAEVSRGYAMPHQLGLMRRATRVIALTETERAFLLARGVSPDHVSAIPAGIAVDAEWEPPERPLMSRPLVLFLGAATYEKGAIHLVDAMRHLWFMGVDADVALLGTITEQFARYLATLPAADRERVQLVGYVSDAEKEVWLERCTLLAMPSRVDSFGIVFLEAWAHGKPVVGARAGGIPDVIDDGVNGVLVPFGDVPGLATAIRRLIEQPLVAAQLGMAGRRKLEQTYDWRRVYPQLLALYEQALVEP